MIRYISILIIFLFCNNIIAQKKIIINVLYDFTYVRDLSDREHPYQQDMILSIGKNHSRYGSKRRFDQNSRAQKEKLAALQNMPSSTMITASGRPGFIVNNQGILTNEEIITDFKDKKMILYGVILQSYKIKSDLPQIKWDIQEDRKTIQNYECQKAIGTYGGRTYHVWFAPELPFQNGPWKLSGLPGLILEAQDDKNEIAFKVKEITKNTDPNETTTSYMANVHNVDTNLKNYNKIKMQFETDPETIMAARYPNTEIGVINIEDPESHTAKKIKTYNPMEID